jgi:glutamyl/glutaminyl-tRNA synthetase
VFDVVKLEWMNGEYIRGMKNDELRIKIYEFYEKKLDQEVIEKTIPLVQERIKKLSDYKPLTEFIFERPEKYQIDLKPSKKLISKMHDSLKSLDDWKAAEIGRVMQELALSENVKNSEFFMILRVVVTGKKISPPLNESMELLGKKEILERLSLSS